MDVPAYLGELRLKIVATNMISPTPSVTEKVTPIGFLGSVYRKRGIQFPLG